jgi:hypothetical protein
MRSSRDPMRTGASFDDPNLVSRAGLVPVMSLAERAGLEALVRRHVQIAAPCGVLNRPSGQGGNVRDTRRCLDPGQIPRAIWDDHLRRWASDAEVAEAPYTAFASKKNNAIPPG